MKVKEECEKVGLKLNIQKTKIMASSPITSRQIDGKQWKQWLTLLLRSKRLLISWLQSPSAVILEPPKSLQMEMEPDAMILVF